MKKLILLSAVLSICFACKKEYTPRNFDEVTIENFKIENLNLRAVAPISETEAYFAGPKGTIGHTKDGGKTWQLKNIIFEDTITPAFRGIAYANNNLFALSIGFPGLLYKTKETQVELVYKEDHPKVFYDAIAFFDDKNGIAVGDPISDCIDMITTSDGGNTWQKVDCKNLPPLADGEWFYAASNTNIAVVNKTAWVATGGTKSRIFKTTDMGKTWTVYDTPIIQGKAPEGIYSVDFYDENNGIVIGGNFKQPKDNTNNIAITTDGGKTWEVVANKQNSGHKACVQYVPNTDAKEVFAVSYYGVSFSNDGGRTWKEVNTNGYYSIQFIDENTAWLAGPEKIGKLKLN